MMVAEVSFPVDQSQNQSIDSEAQQTDQHFNKPITPELEALNEVKSGIYRTKEFGLRGTVCEYFPQNLLASTILQQHWNQFIAELAVSDEVKEAIGERLPSYDKAVSIINGVNVVYYDNFSYKYKPYLVDGEQLVLDDILFRQGFNKPLAIVVKGPYAGLILSMKLGQDIPEAGYKPEDINELVVERLLNDESLFDRGWLRKPYEVNLANFVVAGLSSDQHTTFELQKMIDDEIIELDRKVKKKIIEYRQYASKNNLDNSIVAHLDYLLTRMGIVDDFKDVNYYLVNE